MEQDRAQRLIVAALACVLATQAIAVDISNRYRSPRNPERSVRRSTELIVLHTTEAPAKSSLNKLSDRGEAHFCVTEDGSVYRIVDRDREAFHAGRSMWNGKEDVDKFSIGIECVGYHNKPMPSPQLRAIAELVRELKAMYRLPDSKVVCHSHVAYGAPNKWQKRRHRGRKRCGMLFAMPSVRRALGLSARPALDPDTRAGRLTVGDEYLKKVLYGNVDTMRGVVSGTAVASTAASKEASSGGWLSRLFRKDTSANPRPAPPKPVKKRPVVARVSPPQPALVKPKPAGTKPAVRTATVKQAVPKTIADLKRMGYSARGIVSRNMTAVRIAGAKWNAATTYYTIRNKVIPGASIDPAHIEVGMAIWMK